MKVAFGIKAHSGWAALVALGSERGGLAVIDRRRLVLAGEAWAKMPYHAAEKLKAEAAREKVRRGIEAAHRLAASELGAALKREHERGNEVVACAVLVGAPMPAWSTDQILAVHFRMHKAEGALFRDALAQAAQACGVKLVAVPEKTLAGNAAQMARVGKPAGPPWGEDQKDAALAAVLALDARLAPH